MRENRVTSDRQMSKWMSRNERVNANEWSCDSDTGKCLPVDCRGRRVCLSCQCDRRSSSGGHENTSETQKPVKVCVTQAYKGCCCAVRFSLTSSPMLSLSFLACSDAPSSQTPFPIRLWGTEGICNSQQTNGVMQIKCRHTDGADRLIT